MVRNNILFVDKERFFLKAIKRSFRNSGNAWNLLLASSPAQALETAESVGVDVVITGLVFSGQSGLDLLNEFKNRHPQTMRIILSGHTDHDLILKSVDLAHQFLAKPCDDSDIIDAISRACMVKNLLDHEPLRMVATQIGALPSMPCLHIELVEELNSEDTSIEKIGDIISKDWGLTAKVLKLVNSSFFGPSQRITNPAKAVSLLGMDLVRSVVSKSNTFDQFNENGPKGFSVETLWEHATATAIMAKRISKYAGLDESAVEASFVGGLLHDIGKLVLAIHLPEKLSIIAQHMDNSTAPMFQAETAIFGTTHAAIGAYLLGLWGIPFQIVEAAAFHHTPGKSKANGLSPATIVHVANAFANAGFQLNDCNDIIDGIDYEFLENAQLLDQFEQWRKVCADLQLMLQW
jgi:HD-like signal output (HDOD) protein